MSSPSSDDLPLGALGGDHNDKRTYGNPEVWNSFGFVEVGEQRMPEGESFGYPMKRTKSSLFTENNEESMTANYRFLEKRLLLLQREVGTIRRKVDIFEEDSGKSIKWGVKYTRRFTLVSNIALGLFVFMSRFVRRIQLRKNKILQNMMVPNGTTSATFNGILNEAYIQSIAKSWFFFVAAICLASDTAWKRNVGILVSTVASIWPIFKNRHAWAHYLSLLSTSAYIFAEWATAETKEANVKTLRDFIGPYVESPSNNPTVSSTPVPSRVHHNLPIPRSNESLEDMTALNLVEHPLPSPRKHHLHSDTETSILRQSLGIPATES